MREMTVTKNKFPRRCKNVMCRAKVFDERESVLKLYNTEMERERERGRWRKSVCVCIEWSATGMRVYMSVYTRITIGKCVVQVVRKIGSKRFSSSNFAKLTKSKLKQENFSTNKSVMIQS